jgi:hypothetical protein
MEKRCSDPEVTIETDPLFSPTFLLPQVLFKADGNFDIMSKPSRY